MSTRPRRPGLEGTIVSPNVADSAAQVKAIAIKKGITLVSMDSPGMWHQVGFLADAFQVFKQQGLSVDLVSTSETNVTVSLDPAANTLDAAALSASDRGARGAVPRRDPGPCAVEPAGPQHSRHPARARRGLRAVPGSEDLSGEQAAND
jgi:diaminopimelate decarboxylase/aspartate kinase